MSTLPLAPSEYGQKAINLIIRVRELMSEIQGYRFAAKGRRQKIGSAASVPEEFLVRLAAALDANPGLAQKGELTGPEIRDRLDYAREFANFGAEVLLFGKGVEDTVAEILADIGSRGLAAYRVAQEMEKRAGNDSLVPHMVGLRRALGRGRPRKLKKPADPAAVKKGDAK